MFPPDETHATIRIGCGAGYSGDRIEPAVELAEQGELDYLVFECLAERTIALAQQARRATRRAATTRCSRRGCEAVLPRCRAHGVTHHHQHGRGQPARGRRAGAATSRARLGLRGLAIAAVTGDDVLDVVASGDFAIAETGEPVAALGDRLVSANAYLGAEPIVEALAGGADVVITGRVADPSLFLAPLVHEFGWAHGRLGRARARHAGRAPARVRRAGHGRLLRRSRATRTSPDLARLGFPIARGRRGRPGRHHEGAGLRRRGDAGDVQGAAALRDPRSPRRTSRPTSSRTSAACAVDRGRARPRARRRRGAGGRGRRRSRCRSATATASSARGRSPTPGRARWSAARWPRASSASGWRWPALRRRDPLRPDRRRRAARRGAVAATGRAVRGARCGSRRATATLDERAGIGNEVETLYTNGPAGGGGATKSAREVLSVASTFVPRVARDLPRAIARWPDMKLRDHRPLAHRRQGRRSRTSRSIAYDAADYPRLVRQVTPERVKARFGRAGRWARSSATSCRRSARSTSCCTACSAAA